MFTPYISPNPASSISKWHLLVFKLWMLLFFMSFKGVLKCVHWVFRKVFSVFTCYIHLHIWVRVMCEALCWAQRYAVTRTSHTCDKCCEGHQQGDEIVSRGGVEGEGELGMRQQATALYWVVRKCYPSLKRI